MSFTVGDIERFESKISPEPNTGCWLWLGTVANNGYGAFACWHRPNAVRAHRMSYELYVGDIPVGMYVCHRCDVRICVNPDHLFVGTHRDNMQDSVRKHRHTTQQPGYRGSAKLTASQVELIQQTQLTPQVTRSRLARQFGVCRTTITNIRTGRTSRY